MLISKKAAEKSSSPTTSLQYGGVPLERLAIDVLGPLQETDQGNQCILVVIDYFRKWAPLLVMPEESGATVVDLSITEVIFSNGDPLQIHADRGLDFTSVLF